MASLLVDLIETENNFISYLLSFKHVQYFINISRDLQAIIIKWDTKVYFTDFIELSPNCDLSLSSEEREDHHELKIEIRLSFYPVEVDGLEFDVGFKQVSGYLDLEGYEFVPGDRYGDHTTAVTIEISKELSKKSGRNLEKSNSGELTVSDKGVGAGVVKKSGSGQADEYQKVVKYDSEIWLVNTLPNGGWRFKCAADKTFLEGVLVPANAILCKIKQQTGANRNAVQFNVMAQKKHIHFDPSNVKAKPFCRKPSINQEKVAKCLVAKYLDEETGSLGPNGMIVLANTKFNDD